MKKLAILRAAALAVAASLALAGCGASDDAPASQGATRTVENVDGSKVKVPEHPKRVVTLSEPTTDGMLALGLKPIGVVAGRGQSTVSHYLVDRAKGIPVLGGVAQPNYEAIGKAKPDLILVDGTSINNNQEAIDTLTHIAPTVITGYAGGDWRKNFDRVADAVNEKAKAEKVEAAYDDRVKTVAVKLKEKGLDASTFSIVRWQGNSASLILLELPAGRALTDLGLKRPDNQNHKGRGHSDPVSLENLSAIDADYMFFGTLGGSSVNNPSAGGKADDAAAKQAVTEATKTPGFTSLKAYRDGHVIPVDGSTWTSTGGPILMTSIVDDVERTLLAG